MARSAATGQGPRGRALARLSASWPSDREGVSFDHQWLPLSGTAAAQGASDPESMSMEVPDSESSASPADSDYPGVVASRMKEILPQVEAALLKGTVEP